MYGGSEAPYGGQDKLSQIESCLHLLTFHRQVTDGASESETVRLITGWPLNFDPTVSAHIAETYLLLHSVGGRRDLELEDLRTLFQQLPGVEDVRIAAVKLTALTQHHSVKQSERGCGGWKCGVCVYVCVCVEGGRDNKYSVIQ